MARLHWIDYGVNHSFTSTPSDMTVNETVNGALVSVDVSIEGDNFSTGSFTQVRSFPQYIDSNGHVDFAQNSTLKIYSGGIDQDGNPADGFKAGDLTINFDQPTSSDTNLVANPVVQNLYFRLNDIDGNDVEWIDQISIVAYNEFGQEIPVSITFEPTTDLTLGLNNTIQGAQDAYFTQSPEASAFVEIAGPVSSIEISYYANDERELGEGIQFVSMTDIHFEFAEAREPEVDHFRFPSEPIDAFPLDDLDSVTGDDTANLILTGDDADTIDGLGGDDTLNGGIDDDLIRGGDGDDLLIGDRGNDTIEGDDGDDVIVSSADPALHDYSDYGDTPGGGTSYDDPKFDPTGIEGWFTDPNPDDDRDSVQAGAGADVVFTGDDADTIFGGGGDDYLDGGIDDDLIDGGDGEDDIYGDHGSDTIFGRDGSDYIDASDSSLLYPNELDATDPFPDNDRDVVDGGTGDDTIFGGDDDDSLHGGTGFDIIDGGIDEDTLSGGREQDSLYGGQGNDLLFGFNHDDSLNSGEGSGTLPLFGDHDYLEGNEGDDTLYGGSGSDTLLGGDGADVMFGGEDDDWFHNVTAGDVIDGNETGNDHDTLSFRPLGEIGPQLATRSTIRFDDPDNPGGTIELNFDPGNFENGTATYRDSSDVVTGTMRFTHIENIIIPCFTPGTRIATIRGEVLVEDLEVGDRIITRDNGIQDIRWIGTRSLTRTEMLGQQNLLPIRIRQGALGNGLPERDMMVSPNHRMLVASEKAAFFFEEREVLVAAKHLVGMPGVEVADVADVTYIHFMFDHHEVVLSDGTWSESFQPGDQTIGGLDQDQRDELLTLFPELAQADGVAGYAAARRSLKKYEAQLLVG